MRRSEGFLKGGDGTFISKGNLKMGSEVYWSAVQLSEVKWRKWNEVDWSDDLRWIVCIIIDL